MTRSPRKERDDRIAVVMAAQDGLACFTDLAEAGLPLATRRHRVSTGTWHLVAPRVVSPLPWEALGEHARLRAGLLSAGPGAFIAGVTAACLLRTWRGRAPIRPQIITPRDVRSASEHLDVRANVIVREGDSIEVDGLAVASPARAIPDAARELTIWQVANILHETAFRYGPVREGLEDVLQSLGRQRGVTVARQALALHLAGSAGTRSFAEDSFITSLQRAGRRIEWVGRHVDAPGGSVEADFHWPELRLCIEIDGSGHARANTAADDASRQARLEAGGQRVIRLTAAQAKAPPAEVLALLPREPSRSRQATRRRPRVLA